MGIEKFAARVVVGVVAVGTQVPPVGAASSKCARATVGKKSGASVCVLRGGDRSQFPELRQLRLFKSLVREADQMEQG